MTLNMRQAYTDVEFQQVVDTRTALGGGISPYRDAFKRVLDLAVVALILMPVSLVLVVLAGLVALDGRNPFYTQERVGRNGRTFRMFKLRSMVPDADRMLDAHLAQSAAARIEWDATQKLKCDPRITRIGRIIRKTSLDELPQIFNVLLGSMSIVGPRPMMVQQRAMYPGLAYYALRPGITGYWQISVRNDSNFSERAVFDTRYFRELSLVTDVRVMVRTVSVVLNGTGY